MPITITPLQAYAINVTKTDLRLALRWLYNRSILNEVEVWGRGRNGRDTYKITVHIPDRFSPTQGYDMVREALGHRYPVNLERTSLAA